MPYYNTASPTPSTKNTITSIAVTYGIRDFLLNKNLQPFYPYLATSINGSPRVGEPVLDTEINGNSNVTPFGLPLEVEGLLRYQVATLPNQYKDKEEPSLTNIENISKIPGTTFGSIGFDQGTSEYPTSATEEIKQYGIIGKTEFAGFRKKSTLFNLYIDRTKQIDMADFISLQPSGFAQQVDGYTDVYGGLNRGDTQAIQASNIIGSVLNGQGLGLAKGGIVTNFDFRASLAGRTLGTNGLVNDTKLGLIGSQQLALAMANNAAFNSEQILFGALNTQDNLLSLVKGGPLPGLRPNYKITIPSGALGRAGDYAARILGFTIPKSYMSEAGSIFTSENQSGNIDRANSMIENTGKGQVLALIANFNANLIGSGDFDNPTTTAFRSGYSPGYLNNKGQKAINPNLYAFYDDKNKGTILNFLNADDGLIPSISYNRSAMISDYGFQAPEENKDGFIAGQPNTNPTYDNRKISDITFSWGSYKGGNVNSNADYSNINGNRKSLLIKTQKLFDSKGMKNIISVKGDKDKHSSQIETANNGMISKGSAVLSKELFDVNGSVSGSLEVNNTFCRSWTTIGRYDSVKNLVRKKGLYESGKVPYRFQTENSTLDKYGFPKIAPYTTDKNSVRNESGSFTTADPKKFMFSIENLAWADEWSNLPPVEVGMGDLLSGKRGRIMWFPPYNIQFNETSNVNWESTNFIGRGEPIYTYNNTERSGNLSFSIIVDHPSYANAFRNPNGPDDNYVASFFAGCVDPESQFGNKLTISEKSFIANQDIPKPKELNITPEKAPDGFIVFFPNDSSDVDSLLSKGYENGLMNGSTTPYQKIDYNIYDSGYGINSYVGSGTSLTPWNDNHNYGLNGWYDGYIQLDGITYSGFSDPTYGPALAKYLDEKCPHCIIKITSYASPQGNPISNEKLANERTDAIKEYLLYNLEIFANKKPSYINKRFPKQKNVALTSTQSGCSTLKNAPTDTFECKFDRRSVITFEFSSDLAAEDLTRQEPVITPVQPNISNKILNRLYDESKYFEKLTEKDKFVFDSFREKIRYFHPAFHSTTPEGLNSRLTFLHQCTRQGPRLTEQGANNLAFGRPPVCILRLGDFYNSKIIIDNINIDYEPLVWDLNPEGIGVQPMIANVNMSFKFVGGSSLMSPLNKLQNALSFNYYANSQVYDPRADYVEKRTDDSDKNGATALRPYKLVNGATNMQKFK